MRFGTAIFAIVIGIAVTGSGCGDSSSSNPPSGAGANVGADINLANCDDWEHSSADERLGTIQQLKNFAGSQVTSGQSGGASGKGAVLGDDQAYDLLDRYCKNDFARGFKLYILYQRAASFAGHR